VSPELAKERGIQSGSLVQLTSRRGRLRVRALVTDRVHDGELYMPMNSQLGVAKHGLQGDEFLRREMLPRYRHLLEMSDQVGALNIHDVNSRETEMVRVFAALRRELVAGGIAAICLGVICHRQHPPHITLGAKF
jgi:predicted molibdopterin-dependent oxidoreductase YjgC